MNSNQAILAGGVVIISVGFVSATVNNRPKTPVFVGGAGIVLLASLVSMAGGNAAKLSTAFMGLAVVAVLLVELPDVFSVLSKVKNPGTPTVNTGGVTVTSRSSGQVGGTGTIKTVNTGGVTVTSRVGNIGGNF